MQQTESKFECKKYNNTQQYEITIGFIPGYQPDINLSRLHNLKKDFNIEYFNNLYQQISRSNPIATVSGVIQKALVSYPTEWGCPENGEPVYKITCTRNPKFNPSESEFREAVLYNVEQLQKALKQSSVNVVEHQCDVYYFNKIDERDESYGKNERIYEK